MRDLEFKLILDKELPIPTIWKKLVSIITSEFQIHSPYNVKINGEFKAKDFFSIDKEMSVSKNESYFSLTSADHSNRHTFDYYLINRQVRIRFPLDDLTQGIESLKNKLYQSFSFSNMIYRKENEKGYFEKAFETEWYQPRKHNLFMMPAFHSKRKFYIEGVTAEMWFGESFWQYASCSREEVVSCDWLQTKELENSVLYIKAYHKEFDEAEGEQLVIQRRLLKLLFNIDENRPHGYEPTGAKPKTFVQKVYTDGQNTIVGDLKEQRE